MPTPGGRRWRGVVYWFAEDGVTPKGFSLDPRGSRFAVVEPKIDPVLRASFFLIDRRVCGDWSY